jgi:hypothetical protein
MPKLFDQARVDEAAEFIAAELKPLLDYKHIDGPISRRIIEACPAYPRGLTNGERVVATLKALNLAALEVMRDLTALWRDPTLAEKWEDEEENEPELGLEIPPADAAPPNLKLV